MAIRTVKRVTLEKLNPATSITGLSAEIAEVTRHYRIDIDTNEETEYGTPQIDVLWGVTVASKIAALEDEKLKVDLRAEEEKKNLDDQKLVLGAKGVEVVENVV